MIAFAQDPGPPTIGDLVPQYVAVGISKRDGVRYIVDSHMRRAVAKGKGRRAARRQLAVLLAAWVEPVRAPHISTGSALAQIITFPPHQ